MLRRAAFSPNIKERADCSAALFSPTGELLAQAENIPVHLGSMPASVRAAIDAGVSRPGEQVIVNDPFAGGTHLNDITVGHAVVRRRSAGRVGGDPGAPRRRRRRGSRFAAGRRHRRVRRRAAAAAGTADRRGADAGAGQLPHARRAGRRPRRPGRGQPRGRGPPGRVGGVDRCAPARGARLRRAAHAGGAGRSPRRHLAVHRRARQLRAPARAAGSLDDRGRGHRVGRRDRVRLHRDRSAAGRRGQRGRGGDGQRGRLRAAGRHRRDAAGQRRRAPTGAGDGSARHDRQRPTAGRGGGGQRRGEPAGGRRLPRGAGPGGARMRWGPPRRGR